MTDTEHLRRVGESLSLAACGTDIFLPRITSPEVMSALSDWFLQHAEEHSTYDCRWEPCAATECAAAIFGGNEPA